MLFVYELGILLKHKWENCLTLDKYSWGYRRNLVSADILTMFDLTRILAQTIRYLHSTILCMTALHNCCPVQLCTSLLHRTTVCITVLRNYCTAGLCTSLHCTTLVLHDCAHHYTVQLLHMSIHARSSYVCTCVSVSMSLHILFL